MSPCRLVHEDFGHGLVLELFNAAAEGRPIEEYLKFFSALTIRTSSERLAELFSVLRIVPELDLQKLADAVREGGGLAFYLGLCIEHGRVKGVVTESAETLERTADPELTALVIVKSRAWTDLKTGKSFRSDAVCSSLTEELENVVLPYLNESVWGATLTDVRTGKKSTIEGFPSASEAAAAARHEWPELAINPEFRRIGFARARPETEFLRRWRDLRKRPSTALLMLGAPDTERLFIWARPFSGTEALLGRARFLRPSKRSRQCVLFWDGVCWNEGEEKALDAFLKTVKAPKRRFIRLRTGTGELVTASGDLELPDADAVSDRPLKALLRGLPL